VPQDAQLVDDRVALVLADGRKVLKDGTVVEEVPANAVVISREISSGRSAARTLERMHRKLGDLPDIPQKMNPVAAVILYTCIGLNNADIATALGAEESQIQTIKDSELYGALFKLFDETVFADAKQNARHIIAKASDKAANVLVDSLDSNNEGARIAASREITRLAGLSLEQTNENKLSGLHIRITRKEDEQSDLTVEIK
jgi:hypothetical protein